MAEQALAGLKVVEYGDLISAAYCAKLLADLGAEVIKVEGPQGGDSARRYGPFPQDEPHPEKSGLFLHLNTNKLGITLDVSAATGRDILLRLVQGADVFVTNHPRHLLEALGLDYAPLSRLNPNLIATYITPYGLTGPYRDYKGYEINCAALGGITEQMGEYGREPLVPPYFQGSQHAGLNAASATLVALLARDVAGRGQEVDIAEADLWATIHTGMNIMYYVIEGGEGLGGRASGRQGMGTYPSGYIACKDGYICWGAPQVAQWIRFVHLVGDPEWAKLPRYRDRYAMARDYPDEVDALLAPWFNARTKEEVFHLCQAERVPFAPVRNMAEVVAEEQHNQRGFFVEAEHPQAGRLKYPGAAYLLSETPFSIRSPAPLLGQHNEEIYCGRLGYSREQLAGLRQAGII